jgi:alpha-beta hydrolase superfamily lysophospholipase
MIDISKLKPLAPFSWQNFTPRNIDLDYFAFYHIDFTEALGTQLKHHFGVMPLAGYDIAVHHLTLPTNTKTVVFIHGYFDHTGLYGPLFLMLLKNGFNILTYDLPGHGLSSGEPAGIPSFEDYQAVLKGLLDAAKGHLAQPLYLMGQSTGGAIAMDYVLYNPAHQFQKLVLLAPLVIPKNWAFLRGILFSLKYFFQRLTENI